MSLQRRVCERCACVYQLQDSYLEEKLPEGKRVKVRSADSYKYCQECLAWLASQKDQSR